MKIILCAIAKMENDYIREWIKWHKEMGFDNICLYDNNDINGEKLEDAIKEYIDEGYVILKNKRGVIDAQVPAYNECYKEYNKEYDWIAFWDIDEFLEIEDGLNIHQFLDKPCFENKFWVRLCWKQYTDSGLVAVKDGNYSIKRFTEVLDKDFCKRNGVPVSTYYRTGQCKSMVRGGLNDFHITSPHVYMKKYNAVDAVGEKCLNNGVWLNTKGTDLLWKGAWLNHYRFKTIEEYCEGKMRRLYPTSYMDHGKSILKPEYFFEFNQKTPEKEKYVTEYMQRKNSPTINVGGFWKMENNEARENNWGDELNFWFVRDITAKSIRHDPAGENFLFIGSTICDSFVNRNTVIWGAGSVCKPGSLTVKPKEVRAVRGPLTRRFLLENGIDCPEVYGDPAMLLPMHYKPDVEKKYELGIIPHWKTGINDHIVKGLTESCAEKVKVIDMHRYGKWTDVVDQILECKYIASESLHGLIVAEAYNVPNLWIRIHLDNSDTKFHDFFLSIGADRKGPLEIRGGVTVEDVLHEARRYKKAPGLDLKPLIRACPFELEFGRRWGAEAAGVMKANASNGPRIKHKKLVLRKAQATYWGV